MHPLQESWDRSTRHLTTARDLLDLDESTLRDVNEYLDHNELGLALEVIVDACEQLGDAVALAAWSSLRAAVQEMQIGPDDEAHGSAAREVLRH
ncbi:MafI family immunity protein [Nocardioides sp.]|uniref:MafI family immunity protein n=1 Tax=Nocardioides sp. TaxID=35761 RepID=UPI002B678159|nr:MafI family immunity protein [Nocardioides sp.]HXH77032.1 MafI family immunity protein [Nocardioides sp.]